jgi:antitoxin (DNA-binding transcriptional repressor) of toxin-antitoxin stability system
MIEVGMRELRAELASHVGRAASGQTVLVRLNGRPVAALGPVGRTEAEPTMDGLAASGALVAARRADGRRAQGAVRVWRNARLDLLLREIRG